MTKPIKLNREQFFAYHANNGGKILTCYISNTLYHINKREWNNLPTGKKIELPCGTCYTMP